ncbi:prepilin-type N-terminal cleavage/methylation domain-containing protein, partial [Salmonella enterica]|nr:prepilin-type N-terminal cleavage/methylation domain-containing protein [Salmonella enterica]
MIKKKGFTLLEVSIVLGIGTLIAFMKFQDMRNNQEAVLADNVG